MKEKSLPRQLPVAIGRGTLSQGGVFVLSITHPTPTLAVGAPFSRGDIVLCSLFSVLYSLFSILCSLLVVT